MRYGGTCLLLSEAVESNTLDAVAENNGHFVTFPDLGCKRVEPMSENGWPVEESIFEVEAAMEFGSGFDDCMEILVSANEHYTVFYDNWMERETWI
jgi:hypothetical protein